MTAVIAAQGHVGIRREESFASGGAATAYQPIFSEDITTSKNYDYQDRIMNTSEQVGAQLMNETVAGSITFPVTPAGPEEWWRCGVGGSATPYAPARPLSSMAIEIDRETGAIYTSGDRIASLDISSAAGQGLQCVAAIEGKGMQTYAATTPSFTASDDSFQHSEATFEIDDVVDNSIMSFSVTINNNLVTDLFTNTRERRDIPATKCMVTGSIVKIFEDAVTRNNFFSGDSVRLEAIYARGSNVFTITLPKVRFDTDSAPLSSQTDYIAETIAFTAYVDDPSTENSITISVI